jgi:hypothetical protein
MEMESWGHKYNPSRSMYELKASSRAAWMATSLSPSLATVGYNKNFRFDRHHNLFDSVRFW